MQERVSSGIGRLIPSRKASLLAAMVSAGALFYSAWAPALGLGEISLHSALNQPLNADIELLDAQGLDRSDLAVGLATADEYSRAGIERVFFLNDLRFTPVFQGNRRFIHVSSTRPVVEPYLSFLVQVSRPGGQLLRDYTVLLDPAGTVALSPATIPTGSRALADQGSDYTRAAASTSAPAQPPEAPAKAAPKAASAPATSENKHYEVQAGDTLWTIGKKLSAAGTPTPINQLVRELRQLNPSRKPLQQGQSLLVPDAAVLPGELAGAATPVTDADEAAPRTPAGAAQTPEQLTAEALQQRLDETNARLQVLQQQAGQAPGAAAGAAPAGVAPGLSGGNGGVPAGPGAGAVAPGAVPGTNPGAPGNTAASGVGAQGTVPAPGANPAVPGTPAGAPGTHPSMPGAGAPAPGTPAGALPPGGQAASAAVNATPGTAPAGAAAGITPAANGGPASSTPGATASTAPGTAPVPGTTPTAPGTTPGAAPGNASAQPPATAARPAPPPAPAPVEADDNSWLMMIGGLVLILLLLALWLLARRRRQQQASFEPVLALSQVDDDVVVRPARVPVLPVTEAQLNTERRPVRAEPVVATPAPAPVATRRESGPATDALDGASIYIAYGRFNEALGILREGLSNEPNRVDLRLRMLEVLGQQGDAAGFDEQAAVLLSGGYSETALEQLRARYPKLAPPPAPVSPGVGAGAAAAVIAAGVAAATALEREPTPPEEAVEQAGMPAHSVADLEPETGTDAPDLDERTPVFDLPEDDFPDLGSFDDSAEMASAASVEPEPLPESFDEFQLNLDDLSLDADWESVSPFDTPGRARPAAPDVPVEPPEVDHEFASNLKELPEVFEMPDEDFLSDFADPALHVDIEAGIDEDDAGTEHTLDQEALDNAFLDSFITDDDLPELDALTVDFDDIERQQVSAQRLEQAQDCIDQGDFAQASDLLLELLRDGDDASKHAARQLLSSIS